MGQLPRLGLGFRYFLFLKWSLCTLILLVTFCIVDSKINIIITNIKFRLTSNDVNLNPLKYLLIKAI